MKKNGFFCFAIALSLVSVASINSCVQLSGRTNPYDPGNPSNITNSNITNSNITNSNIIPPTSSVSVLTGWSIDAAVGSPDLGSLRCINVPMGQTRRIRFWDTTHIETPPHDVHAMLRVDGANSFALGLSIFVSNTRGGWINITNYSLPSVVSFANILLPSPSFGGNWEDGQPTDFYVVITNGSDSDGTNTVWIDNLRLTNTSHGATHSMQFNNPSFDLFGDRQP